MKIDWKKISLRDLAGFISEELRSEGIDVILVGGACVTIYSENRYLSHDLDFVTYEDLKKVKKVLLRLGFYEHAGSFRQKECLWIVEFVSPPVSVGDEPISEFSQVKTSFGSIKMLRAVDSVKDRLAAFYYWGDRQGMEQAISICLAVDVDFEELRVWSKKEKQMNKFEKFLESFKTYNGKS